MRDREIRVTTAAAAACWVVGTGLVVAGVCTRWYGMPGFGLVLVAVAAVLNVRAFIMDACERMIEAFDMGRDYERLRAQEDRGDVRPMR